MVRIYYREDKVLKKETDVREIGSLTDILWVDLHSPTQEEEEWIESKCEVSIQTPQEITEIESSSRYFERNGMIVANSNFLRFEGETFLSYPVSFIIKGAVVFTYRQGDSKTFADTVKKMKVNSDTLLTGADVLLLIFETRIDSDADSLEAISREITNISRMLAKERKPKGDSLLQINNLQEHTMLLRESIIDKQRVFSALLRSMNFPDDKKERLRIILKDINSLLEYTTFNFERLEYLQDTFTGLINLEQNDIIKRFTLFSIIFLPPTLIAGIFGMNYKEIPTAESEYGFYFAIAIIIGSSLGSLLFFKWKNWI